ncbi:MAG: right-handed parallel beta-helix repeat-containing protein [Spirochaetes bacterium]|nr:right-handed parallel beta-helix repeat-containing protein [Spirochaetota bacterium]
MHSLRGTIFSLFVLLAIPVFPESKTIADFGGKADGAFDNGPALMKAFSYAAVHPGTTLRLGGVCRVSTPQTNETRFKYAAGGTYITNLTIENGEIVLGGAFSAFLFERCPGLTLRNIVFDYDPPIISQGSIIASLAKDRTMTVVPDPGYPPPAAPYFSNRDGNWMTVHKPGGEYGFHFVGYIQQSLPLENGQFSLTHDRGDLARVLDGAVNWRYVRVKRSFGHLNIFKYCDGLRLEGCSIHASSAFASLFMFCNDVVLLNNRICPREGSSNMVATCADGFHFIAARRGPRIEGNYFDRLQDDNIVISLRGSRVKSYKGDTLTLMPMSVTWYETGDTIEIIEIGTGERREYTIKSMPKMDNIWNPPSLTLDRPIEGTIVCAETCGSDDVPSLAFNKSWRLDGTVIRSNRFQNTRRYSVFMGAGGVRIENNTMSNHTSAAILISHTQNFFKKAKSDLIYYLSENVVIAGNSINNALNYGEGGRDFSMHPYGAIDLYNHEGSSSLRTGGVTDAPLARNIEIRSNIIINSGAAGIYIQNAKNVRLIGNSIVDPNRQNTTNKSGILIERAGDVTLKDNSVSGTGFDEPVREVR